LPLSLRKALLVAALSDSFVDRLFAGQEAVTDRLGFRAGVAAKHPTLGTVMEICALRDDSPRLALGTVRVPMEDYAGLSVEDFMVSLYNEHSVQRVMVCWPAGRQEDGQALLAAAVAGLEQEMGALA